MTQLFSPLTVSGDWKGRRETLTLMLEDVVVVALILVGSELGWNS